jgi:hypothetical protein
MRRAHYATPFYPQKLTLTSPTSGGRSIGIVRSRNQATEFVLFCFVDVIQSHYILVTFCFNPQKFLFIETWDNCCSCKFCVSYFWKRRVCVNSVAELVLQLILQASGTGDLTCPRWQQDNGYSWHSSSYEAHCDEPLNANALHQLLGLPVT